MNTRILVCIVAGVLVAHLALLRILANWRAMSEPLAREIKPTFTTSTITYVDEKGTAVKTVREFTVSTRLLDEAELRKLPPPPPAAEAAP